VVAGLVAAVVVVTAVVVDAAGALPVTLIAVRSVPAPTQETSIGQRPGVVREPTVQVQLTRPRRGFCGDRPVAREGPVAYVTVIEHRTDNGETLAVNVAALPAATGEVSLTRRTVAPADDANSNAAAPAAINTRTAVMSSFRRRA
jgi:hypothetical protein